ncbi:MAG: response regulator transcription factor [Desulfomonilia bacterium]|jgi:RNA polymerase sigma factor (sigma-70 family)|nr:response regulator transcription factor [Deltaproteobacteria bacterium]HPD20956.1 response regulator transcription factor [Deltaproteobacteria bacterium]HRS55861.1 response regulator transcription factor [Desulfomonilia bacterium]HRV34566.1 response regulator transcription factor [Desulfomonilia bacterium]
MNDRSDAEILIIDDDASMRKALERLLRSMGYRTRTFSSAQEFLDTDFQSDSVACIVLDVKMPGMSGTDLQKELRKRDLPFPIVFITGHGTIPMSVQAMKHGAVDFLEKPFDEHALVQAISRAVEKGRQAMAFKREISDLEERYRQLTPREKEVLALVVAGMLNKQIAAELGTSEKTIKVHRGRVMEKMQAGSLADLVRMAEKLNIPTP